MLNKKYDELLRPLNLTNVHESLWNDKCDYIDPAKCENLNHTGFNLIVLQLNIHSVLKHSYELKSLLRTLESKNFRVDLVLLWETFLTPETVGLVHIPDYTLVSNQRSKSKGGKTAILIRNGIHYKQVRDLEIFDEGKIESTFIEVLSNKESIGLRAELSM